MDFGRVEDIDDIDFGLPPDHGSILKVLGGDRSFAPAVYVGGVLWSDESFIGTIYPQKAKPADYVKHYVRQFNTIELNLTHYRTPDETSLRRWETAAVDGFNYCPKIHQSVSHAANMLTMIDYYNECARLYKLLNPKLGPCFLQLPPGFHTGRLNELLEFLDRSESRNVAIELRHPGWFSGGKELNTLCNYLYKNKMPLVITDTPGRRDVLHMRLTSKTAFIRFNAHDNHPSDKMRIDAWMQRLLKWFGMGLEKVYFFVHTPKQVNMPGLVAYFIDQLQRVCHIRLKPPLIRLEPPQDNSLF